MLDHPSEIKKSIWEEMRMKKKVLCVVLATMCALSLMACGTEKKAGSKEKLIVGTEAGFAPYEYMKGNEVVGIDIDISQAIADELGMELEIKNMDFDGALAAASSGKVDFIAAGVSVTEERKKQVDFSHEYVNSTEVVVVNKNDPQVQIAGEQLAGSDLNKKIIAVQQGNIADVWVSSKDNCEAKEVKRYTKFAQAAEDLKNNKVDCIVMDKFPAEELVKQNDSLAVLDGILFEDKYAIGVKKGNKELLDQINQVIDKLIEEGKIEEFTANHVQK